MTSRTVAGSGTPSLYSRTPIRVVTLAGVPRASIVCWETWAPAGDGETVTTNATKGTIIRGRMRGTFN